MRKILIFGNSGSGKTTLAKELCTAARLSHLDLDSLAWAATTPPQRLALNESVAEIKDFTSSCNGWVIEGCYADLLEQAVPFANEIIFLDVPVSTCIANAKNRPWEPHKYASSQAQDANLAMLVDWIARYEQRQDIFSRQAHMALYESFQGKKSRYTSNFTST